MIDIKIPIGNVLIPGKANAQSITNGIEITVVVVVVGSPNPSATSIPIFKSASSPICFVMKSLAAFPIGDKPSINTPTTRGIKTITPATPIPIGMISVIPWRVSNPKSTPTIVPIITGSPNAPIRLFTPSKLTSNLFKPGIKSITLFNNQATINVQPVWMIVVQVVPSKP